MDRKMSRLIELAFRQGSVLVTSAWALHVSLAWDWPTSSGELVDQVSVTTRVATSAPLWNQLICISRNDWLEVIIHADEFNLVCLKCRREEEEFSKVHRWAAASTKLASFSLSTSPLFMLTWPFLTWCVRPELGRRRRRRACKQQRRQVCCCSFHASPLLLSRNSMTCYESIQWATLPALAEPSRRLGLSCVTPCRLWGLCDFLSKYSTFLALVDSIHWGILLIFAQSSKRGQINRR